MLNGLRQHTANKAASMRWRLLFWLFAVFAGFEAPVGAQEALGSKPSHLTAALGAKVRTDVQPGVPAVATEVVAEASDSDFTALEPLVSGGVDAVLPRTAVLFVPFSAEPSLCPQPAFGNGCAQTGFKSRAPPLRG